jgi:hypothetical protein
LFCAHGQLDVPQWASSCRWITSPENSQRSHPPYSPDISLCAFWMLGDFKAKLDDRHLQDRKKISRHFKNYRKTSLLKSFKWYLNDGAIGCDGSLNMTESTFRNERFTNRLFHGQAKIGVRSH